MPRRRTRAAAAAVIVLAALGLGGCASADDEPNAEDPATTSSAPTTEDAISEPAEPAGVMVDITITDDSVTPNGERVDAEVGEPVTLHIDAEGPGELHIHSTPEQEIAYDAGTSTHEVTFDQPGIVDIESHDLEKVVVQVEVR